MNNYKMEGETDLQYFLRKNRELAALKDAALRAGKNVIRWDDPASGHEYMFCHHPYLGWFDAKERPGLLHGITLRS